MEHQRASKIDGGHFLFVQTIEQACCIQAWRFTFHVRAALTPALVFVPNPKKYRLACCGRWTVLRWLRQMFWERRDASRMQHGIHRGTKFLSYDVSYARSRMSTPGDFNLDRACRFSFAVKGRLPAFPRPLHIEFRLLKTMTIAEKSSPVLKSLISTRELGFGTRIAYFRRAWAR